MSRESYAKRQREKIKRLGLSYRSGTTSFKQSLQGQAALEDALSGRGWSPGWREVKAWNAARAVTYVNEHEWNVRRALFAQGKNPEVWS